MSWFDEIMEIDFFNTMYLRLQGVFVTHTNLDHIKIQLKKTYQNTENEIRDYYLRLNEHEWKLFASNLIEQSKGKPNLVFIESDKEPLIKPYWNSLTEFIQHLNNNKYSTSAIKGFQNKLTDTQIKSLYEQMQGNYFDTSPENFKAMLTSNNCYPIAWIHKNNHGEINKTSLVAFIETILKQTKKVSKTHFNTEITSGIKKDMYYDRYVFLFSEMIK